ncbi:hypothetical protein CR513_22021, partial [Mucuna pruriens]
MYIRRGNNLLSCKLFPGTLRGVVMNWLATLPPRSIRSFSDIATSFASQFAANKPTSSTSQNKGETLKSYLAWFNNATVKVNDPNKKFIVKAFQKGLKAVSSTTPWH